MAEDDEDDEEGFDTNSTPEGSVTVQVINSYVHYFIYLFIYIYLFISLFLSLFIYSFIHLFLISLFDMFLSVSPTLSRIFSLSLSYPSSLFLILPHSPSPVSNTLSLPLSLSLSHTNAHSPIFFISPSLFLSLSHSLSLTHSMSQRKKISGQETLPLNPSQFWNQRPKFLQSCHRTVSLLLFKL